MNAWKTSAHAVLRAATVAALCLGSAHLGTLVCTAMQPPESQAACCEPVRWSNAIRQSGRSYVKHHGKILQVGLEGSPAELGCAHGSLLHREMVDNEAALWDVFHRIAPWWPVRAAVVDVSRWRFRGLDQHFPHARLEELAAAARAFRPDPFDDELPTWQRFLYLNALYDIALSFEHSPLIGCSSLVVSGARSAQGHTLLARNFDFETHEVFDRGKAVLLVRENGKIPYASVAWPGLIGVVTGMNARGVGLVVHGARALHPSSEGEPVLLTMRDALAESETAQEAAMLVASRNPMVSHLVLIADASGASLVVERAPGSAAHIRRAHDVLTLTNHFEGPLAGDPANLRVRERTSTVDRRARLDELMATLGQPATPLDMARMLRDRKAVGGRGLPPGDRRAIDADIATHGVVMDLSARRLWVSEGPHLQGRFVRFDVGQLLDESYDPELDDPTDPIP
jgi:isopenicillin-N N-acyltransferase like protein